MNEHLQAVQDAAWNVKDACDDIAARKLGERDCAVLDSVKRDLDRLLGRIVAIRDKRKRSPTEGSPLFDDVAAPAEVSNG